MRQELINIYKFEELEQEIQERVLEKYRYIHTEEFPWYGFIIKSFTETLDKIGFENAEIEFSGFYSQGDGLSFTADIDIKKVFNTLMYCQPWKSARQYQYILKWIDCEILDLSFKILNHNSIYYHENTKSVELEGYSYNISSGEIRINNWLEETVKAIQDIIEDLRIELCQDFFSKLKNYYEYLTSDDSVKEVLIDLDYEFTANGDIY